MRAIPDSLAARLGGATTLCHCWRLVLRDGSRLGFTDHDRDITFDGLTHLAASGLDASEVETALGFSGVGGEVAGALMAAALTEADLVGGRYDGATLETWVYGELRKLLTITPEPWFLSHYRDAAGLALVLGHADEVEANVCAGGQLSLSRNDREDRFDGPFVLLLAVVFVLVVVAPAAAAAAAPAALAAAHHLGPRRVIVRSRDGHNDAVDNAVDDANDDLVVLRVIHHRAAHPSTITAHCPAESPQMPWTAALCCSRIIMH
jgi:hypothetical protein